MRFLIDEMYGGEVVDYLREEGHDAIHVRQLVIGATEDHDVLARACEDNYVVVTENASDFLPLLDARTAAGLGVTPVIVVLKANLPSGRAMHRALAKRLCR